MNIPQFKQEVLEAATINNTLWEQLKHNQNNEELKSIKDKIVQHAEHVQKLSRTGTIFSTYKQKVMQAGEDISNAINENARNKFTPHVQKKVLDAIKMLLIIDEETEPSLTSQQRQALETAHSSLSMLTFSEDRNMRAQLERILQAILNAWQTLAQNYGVLRNKPTTSLPRFVPPLNQPRPQKRIAEPQTPPAHPNTHQPNRQLPSPQPTTSPRQKMPEVSAVNKKIRDIRTCKILLGECQKLAGEIREHNSQNNFGKMPPEYHTTLLNWISQLSRIISHPGQYQEEIADHAQNAKKYRQYMAEIKGELIKKQEQRLIPEQTLEEKKAQDLRTCHILWQECLDLTKEIEKYDSQRKLGKMPLEHYTWLVDLMTQFSEVTRNPLEYQEEIAQHAQNAKKYRQHMAEIKGELIKMQSQKEAFDKQESQLRICSELLNEFDELISKINEYNSRNRVENQIQLKEYEWVFKVTDKLRRIILRPEKYAEATEYYARNANNYRKHMEQLRKEYKLG